MRSASRTHQLRIGELASELGLNPKTLRYYEEIRLLPAPRRTSSGYRVYDARARQRLGFIAKAKAIGLTLNEIREILALRDSGESPCEHVLVLLDRKLAKVDQQLRALMDFRQELIVLREEAAETMRADACVCGIIEQHRPARPDEGYH
jgi:DNA-binding transcriptional MerR regulator